jgi:alpha-mannosidase
MPQSKRIQRFIQMLLEQRFSESLELPQWTCKRAVYIEEGEYAWKEGVELVSPGTLSSVPGETLFLENRITVPSGWKGKKAAFLLQTGGEGLLSINGVPYHGLDRNRHQIPLPEKVWEAGELHLTAEVYHTPPLPTDELNGQTENSAPPVHFAEARLVSIDEAIESLYFTVLTYSEAMKQLPAGGVDGILLTDSLMEVVQELSGGSILDQAQVRQAEKKLRTVLANRSSSSSGGTMHMIGQSHIDVAWLWPLKETVRKTSRTFSTVCTLMDEYPGYRYSQSQPQLYAYVKERYPELYERIKQRIAEGRWELVGGMWVEPDLNIPSGESLVRQLLYGRQFFREEFGLEPRVEWLPDTFGYCASLPQILKKSGIDYFMTSKMNWNDTNRFPYDLFYWRGIDGTSILSFLNHGLNENTLPKDVAEHWQSFKQKGVHQEQMLLYGYGDGGGGVTREMLEVLERSEALPELPSCRYSTAHEFFDGVARKSPKLPQWTGDMYLELHRGTYTTHAANKRKNRKSEVLYREAELWNAMGVLSGLATLEQASVLQQGELKEGYKILLLNQFHDIIPGTSIPEVYEKSNRHYKEVESLGRKALDSALKRLVGAIHTEGEGQPVLLFNSLSWDRNDPVELRGGRELAGMAIYDRNGRRLESDLLKDGEDAYILAFHAGMIPATGYKTVWLRSAASDAEEFKPSRQLVNGFWETDFYRIEFDQSCRIVRLLDKRADRELVEPGEVINELQLFHDTPTVWDAWDIDPQFDQQPAGEAELVEAEVVLQGHTKDILRFRWRLNQSLITQNLVLYHQSSRIDFQTNVDWQEEHKLLKAAFPVAILSDKATYEIPFGSVERPTHTNTSWEQAQFEVCGHRWADLSEGGFGISLMNDCKYGYDIRGNRMRLTLLRSPRWPDATADVGNHEFVYSLFPHEGDWRAGSVVREGMQLNHPVIAAAAAAGSGTLPSEASFLRLNGKQTVLDTVKISEDGQGIIFRLYETSGGRERFSLVGAEGSSAEVSWERMAETDLMERATDVKGKESGTVTVRSIHPYEIVTLKLPLTD